MDVRDDAAIVADVEPRGLLPAPSARTPRVPRAPLVPRPRLVDRLAHAASSAQLTVVCAPAGWGKTVLAGQWTLTQPDVLWLTLEPADADPDVFWSHLMSTLADGVPTSERAVTGISPAAVDALADALATGPRRVTLVLDRFELAGGRAVRALGPFLDRAADGLSLVLLTRRRPALPLYRYRIDGRLAELGADDLRLSAKTVGATFTALGLQPSGAAVRAALDACDGWPAAVRLAALELRDRRWTAPSDAQVRACLAPTVGSLGDFLRAEVLGGLADDDRALLRSVSVVDEFSPALAARLCGDRRAERARALAHADPLVIPDATGGRLRLNPLVRGALYAELCRRQPDKAARLHRRVADHLVAQGFPGEAATHAALAGDAAYGAAVLVDAGVVAQCLVASDDARGLDGWVGDAPVETRETAVVQAARAALSGDVDRAAVWLAAAQRFGPGGDASALSETLVHLRVSLSEGDAEAALDAVDRARPAVAALPPAAARVVGAGLQEVEGRISFREGQLDAAAGRLTDAMLRLGEDDGEPRRRRALAMLALVEACRGNLTRADALAETEQRIADDAGIGPDGRSAASALARAWVATERQELARAQLWLTRAVRTRESAEEPTLAALCLLLRVRLMRDRGNLPGARDLLRRSEPESSWLAVPLAHENAVLEAALARDTAGGGAAPDAPGRAAVRGVAGPSADDWPELRVQPSPLQMERLVDRAERLCRQGRSEDGRALVLEALALGEPEQLRRPLRNAGPGVRALLRTDPEVIGRAAWLAPAARRALRPATRRERPTWRTEPPARAVLTPGRPRRAPDEPLTEREREILDRLAQLMSTQEIAASMFISVNTVRTHVRHILDKLAVGRRNEAVRRARELGLV
ncbi:LuxR C-terminal-related transcriptional regulator [Cellulomonas alba]|uniref:LuxR C-terminal-related transcriptional regulator n=1 Tax=Cellulomonas alba TaxID=3053467 RepID=A0ABT7SH68_9CELL|nr:LuxR C-terminal-related transcriptional regulator [Cellulomonas alba]MDM7855538.1 LuxR C-terminal-related transcriptional regulator [Cellulomonas alba]